MKVLNQLCHDIQENLKDGRAILCDFVTSPGGIVQLHSPILSCEHECAWCGGTACYCPLVDPKQSASRTWLCANVDCDVYKALTHVRPAQPTSLPRRALEWPKFCEINGIGDLNYTIRFEDIEQSQGKISYMLKFVASPCGILFMQGDPGTGKTFAALAMCELYTRKDTSCIFTTQKKMSNDWLESFKKDRFNNYIDKVTNCKLLVIDDFGTADIAAAFTSFFMDLINQRIQWTNRGTVITTNLDQKKFALCCGEALSDRINTGQLFYFKGKTRRKSMIL